MRLKIKRNGYLVQNFVLFMMMLLAFLFFLQIFKIECQIDQNEHY